MFIYQQSISITLSSPKVVFSVEFYQSYNKMKTSTILTISGLSLIFTSVLMWLSTRYNVSFEDAPRGSYKKLGPKGRKMTFTVTNMLFFLGIVLIAVSQLVVETGSPSFYKPAFASPPAAQYKCNFSVIGPNLEVPCHPVCGNDLPTGCSSGYNPWSQSQPPPCIWCPQLTYKQCMDLKQLLQDSGMSHRAADVNCTGLGGVPRYLNLDGGDACGGTLSYYPLAAECASGRSKGMCPDSNQKVECVYPFTIPET
jgi:hypothetical protein